MRKILLALAAVGPGLFLIGYNIGTGSIVTMSKAGANHSMALFWAVALSCVFTFVLMVAYGKLTIVTGHTALADYRRHIPAGGLGTALAVYVMAALILGELLALIGIFGDYDKPGHKLSGRLALIKSHVPVPDEEKSIFDGLDLDESPWPTR